MVVTRIHIVAFLATLASCGAARQASFSLEWPSCTGDLAACRAKCQGTPPTPGDRESCDVLKVVAAEDYITNPTKEDPEPLEREMAALCRNGISRACDASEKLKPLGVERRANKLASEKAGRQTVDAFKERLAEARRSAEELRKSLGAKYFAEQALKLIGHAETCREPCPEPLNEADKLLAQGKEIADREATLARDAEAQKQAARAERADQEALKAAFQRARESCSADLKACREGCSADPASDDCPALGFLYATGDQRVSPSGLNPEKGRDLAKKGCDGGNKIACTALPGFEDAVARVAERKKAEGRLPGLLAKCDKNKAAVVQMRAAVETAKRQRDRERLLELQSKAQALSAEVMETGNEVNETIATATGREEPRYAQLIEQARRRCVP